MVNHQLLQQCTLDPHSVGPHWLGRWSRIPFSILWHSSSACWALRFVLYEGLSPGVTEMWPSDFLNSFGDRVNTSPLFVVRLNFINVCSIRAPVPHVLYRKDAYLTIYVVWANSIRIYDCNWHYLSKTINSGLTIEWLPTFKYWLAVWTKTHLSKISVKFVTKILFCTICCPCASNF